MTIKKFLSKAEVEASIAATYVEMPTLAVEVGATQISAVSLSFDGKLVATKFTP